MMSHRKGEGMLEFNFFTLLYQYLRADAIFFYARIKVKDGIAMGAEMYKQKWSKAKKQQKNLVCAALKDRVDIHIVNYRKAHDRLGRAVLTVDKKEIWSMCTISSEVARDKKELELIREDDGESPLPYRERAERAYELIKEQGIFGQNDFIDALQEYFCTPISLSLQSNNLLIKIFGLIDKRAGKRTLARIKDSMQMESELIQYFYRLRCEAEGIK